jgi:predicted RNA methylase
MQDFWRTFIRGGVLHEPTAPGLFHGILRSVGIPYERTVFVDVGSGAGRVVLMASEYPFKAVIGIELSPELHAVAQANLRSFPAARRRAWDTRLVCGDATTYSLPPDPVLLYLYNPFGVAPMRRFLANVESSLVGRHHPLSIVLAYCYKDSRELMEQSPHLRVVQAAAGVTVLHGPPA